MNFKVKATASRSKKAGSHKYAHAHVLRGGNVHPKLNDFSFDTSDTGGDKSISSSMSLLQGHASLVPKKHVSAHILPIDGVHTEL